MFLSTVAMLKVLPPLVHRSHLVIPKYYEYFENEWLAGKKQPFEDISPMKQGDFPASDVSFLEGKS